MQRELGAADSSGVQILGVNAIGREAGNEAITAGRILPWLQDSLAIGAWDLWAVNYRDVVILDGRNVPVAVFNLTTHDLGVPANFDSLEFLIREAGSP